MTKIEIICDSGCVHGNWVAHTRPWRIFFPPGAWPAFQYELFIAAFCCASAVEVRRVCQRRKKFDMPNCKSAKRLASTSETMQVQSRLATFLSQSQSFYSLKTFKLSCSTPPPHQKKFAAQLPAVETNYMEETNLIYPCWLILFKRCSTWKVYVHIVSLNHFIAFDKTVHPSLSQCFSISAFL